MVKNIENIKYKCFYYNHCKNRMNRECEGYGEEFCQDYISLTESSFRTDLDLRNEEFVGRLISNGRTFN